MTQVKELTAWLENSGTLGREEHAATEDSLKWAARTYVVAALGSLAQLLYWASMLFEEEEGILF